MGKIHDAYDAITKIKIVEYHVDCSQRYDDEGLSKDDCDNNFWNSNMGGCPSGYRNIGIGYSMPAFYQDCLAAGWTLQQNPEGTWEWVCPLCSKEEVSDE